MEQKNHFTIRDESGEAPLLEIIRRSDVADGDLVELLRLFIDTTMEGMGETSALAGPLPRSIFEAKPGDLPSLEWDRPGPQTTMPRAIPELREAIGDVSERIRRSFYGELRLVAKNEQSEATPLALLIKVAGLKGTGDVVDFELVRLRTLNSAARQAFITPGSTPEGGEL